MNYTLIRYRAKPERRAENRALIENVFAGLRTAAPQDVAYMALELADGTFVHLVGAPEGGGSRSITESEAFKAFAADIADRQETTPERSAAKLVGEWRMLAEPDNAPR